MDSKDIDYDKLLEMWAEKIYEKVTHIEKKEPKDEYGKGRQAGAIEGYLMAMAILNRLEKLEEYKKGE